MNQMLRNHSDTDVVNGIIISIDKIDSSDVSQDILQGIGKPHTAFYFDGDDGEKVLVAMGYQFTCGNTKTRWFGKKSAFKDRVVKKTSFNIFRGRIYQN